MDFCWFQPLLSYSAFSSTSGNCPLVWRGCVERAVIKHLSHKLWSLPPPRISLKCCLSIACWYLTMSHLCIDLCQVLKPLKRCWNAEISWCISGRNRNWTGQHSLRLDRQPSVWVISSNKLWKPVVGRSLKQLCIKYSCRGENLLFSHF